MKDQKGNNLDTEKLRNEGLQFIQMSDRKREIEGEREREKGAGWEDRLKEKQLRESEKQRKEDALLR